MPGFDARRRLRAGILFLGLWVLAVSGIPLVYAPANSDAPGLASAGAWWVGQGHSGPPTAGFPFVPAVFRQRLWQRVTAGRSLRQRSPHPPRRIYLLYARLNLDGG